MPAAYPLPGSPLLSPPFPALSPLKPLETLPLLLTKIRRSSCARPGGGVRIALDALAVATFTSSASTWVHQYTIYKHTQNTHAHTTTHTHTHTHIHMHTCTHTHTTTGTHAHSGTTWQSTSQQKCPHSPTRHLVFCGTDRICKMI